MAVTKKAGVSAEECAFLLDFARPLQKLRQLFGKRTRIGITAGLLVPVVHVGQESGEFVVGVSRGQPYFTDILKLWKIHHGSHRTLVLAAPAEGLDIVAAFGRHFEEDC